jgi:hypothetical protein
VHRAAIGLVLAASAFAAERWTEYRSGPFHVFSDGGDKAARERLAEMEQIRFVLGGMLKGVSGRDANQLDSVWPIDLVLFANAREYGPNALSAPFVDGGSAILSAGNAENPQPLDWRRELVRRLIEDNAGRMPQSVETALCDLFSTAQVSATRITLGTPPPAGVLAGDRLRAWAKIQYLATNSDYAGRLRVFLNNLQQGGDEGVASRNAFDISIDDLEKRVDAYARAGKFETASLSGLAINPNRDFVERPVADMAPLLAELKAAGKSFSPDSPRGQVAKNNKPALELAAAANPKWAEPHFRLAALETNPIARIKELKTAATLEPRNASYWQTLAEAQAGAEQYNDAAKSWASAERAAPNDGERLRIHQTRMAVEERRAEFDIEERKRLALEREQDLQRLKDAAAAEVHAAEDAANRQLGGLKPGTALVPWWNEEQGEPVSGTLTKIDCLTGPLRLTIQKAAGGNIVLLIRDPQKISVHGGGEATFACGVQKPTRKIQLVHDAKPDAKLGTAGDVRVVEFPR